MSRPIFSYSLEPDCNRPCRATRHYGAMMADIGATVALSARSVAVCKDPFFSFQHIKLVLPVEY